MFQSDVATQKWLQDTLGQFGAVAGTVHQEHGGDLYLTAACNIPPPVIERVLVVARGKGMAGLAQVRRKPIQTCNLQQDDTGRINSMAKLVGGQAAVALPVPDGVGGIRAVVGFAFAYEGEVPAEEIVRMSAAAAGVPRFDPQVLADGSSASGRGTAIDPGQSEH